jgi:hypothetical protein
VRHSFLDFEAFEVADQMHFSSRYFLKFWQTFQTPTDTFFVFGDEGIAMSEVVANDDIAAFSPRQVKEIMIQLMNGIDCECANGCGTDLRDLEQAL